MTRRWHFAPSFGSLLCASLLGPAAAGSPAAEGLRKEIAAQTLLTVASDYETSGGGIRLGLAAGAALPWSALAPGAHGVVRLRASLLEGFGLVGTTELDVGLRFRFTRAWQPEVGLSGWYAFGALVTHHRHTGPARQQSLGHPARAGPRAFRARRELGLHSRAARGPDAISFRQPSPGRLSDAAPGG